jgi:hypothetical protein
MERWDRPESCLRSLSWIWFLFGCRDGEEDTLQDLGWAGWGGMGSRQGERLCCILEQVGLRGWKDL